MTFKHKKRAHKQKQVVRKKAEDAYLKRDPPPKAMGMVWTGLKIINEEKT